MSAGVRIAVRERANQFVLGATITLTRKSKPLKTFSVPAER